MAGGSGTGKSTLLLNLILQDIAAGNGVGLLDPHGDLLKLVLRHIPQQRIEDVILFDAADAEYPFAPNILEAHDESERERIVAETIMALERYFPSSWGPRLERIFQYTLRTVLHAIPGATLADVEQMLTEGKILLANLSTGLLTEKVAGTLGSFLVAKIVNAAFRRAGMPEHQRRPRFLYVDEFQSFMNLSVGFERILAEARKYHRVLAGLVNQYVGQLSQAVRQAIPDTARSRQPRRFPSAVLCQHVEAPYPDRGKTGRSVLGVGMPGASIEGGRAGRHQRSGPTGRHAGAAWVASGLPAERSTCN